MLGFYATQKIIRGTSLAISLGKEVPIGLFSQAIEEIIEIADSLPPPEAKTVLEL